MMIQYQEEEKTENTNKMKQKKLKLFIIMSTNSFFFIKKIINYNSKKLKEKENTIKKIKVYKACLKDL